MNDIIYIIEDYDTGDMTGYWDKNKAINSMVDFYLDTNFGHIGDAIVKAARENKLEEVQLLLDNIKEDFTTLFGDGHYIDCLIGLREVIVEG